MEIGKLLSSGHGVYLPARLEDGQAAQSNAESEPIVDKRFFCEKCLTCFVSKWNLQVHERTVHEKARAHKCSECNSAFGTRSGLRRHVKMVHQRQRPFFCIWCRKHFSHKSSLKMHLQRKHARVWPTQEQAESSARIDCVEDF
eukprot:Plantae.Rhodophyta-Purpureofilum_apyrenoidigerum.ctg42685.p1 GENE.Plantae.Rhodophyta-Purpureofilum_apyrenoidigerum.ctg42685~~Plantae.Rhodophyta-Purpureofilum_apyrenoidigerum.ctg42685.p1  ORF type:complete len:166 (-),score=12.39 Plantae.Rhodophyta-Purpureofilum_apyrenoidigerum.ctg42685:86-514(-)